MTAVHEPCFQLVYVSSATRQFTREELLALVEKSHQSNSRQAITGMLLHRDGSFMQVLEGPEPAVRGLMDKIKLDPRHKGVLVLLDRTVDDRQFADWSMGFRDLHTLSPSEMATFGPFLSDSRASEQLQENPTAALKLLRYFKSTMG